jgi:adenine-specific DNA-methyltransferase
MQVVKMVVKHWVAPSDTMLRTSNWTDIEVSQIGKEIDLPFDNPKSKQLLIELLKLIRNDKDFIILDFFSGSATTAHAVMQLNAEDEGNRKFIMVQLPEETSEESEAYKAGYKNICEIGKERIRRAGKKSKPILR